jgi:hypothetical protein
LEALLRTLRSFFLSATATLLVFAAPAAAARHYAVSGFAALGYGAPLQGAIVQVCELRHGTPRACHRGRTFRGAFVVVVNRINVSLRITVHGGRVGSLAFHGTLIAQDDQIGLAEPIWPRPVPSLPSFRRATRR